MGEGGQAQGRGPGPGEGVGHEGGSQAWGSGVRHGGGSQAPAGGPGTGVVVQGTWPPKPQEAPCPGHPLLLKVEPFFPRKASRV